MYTVYSNPLIGFKPFFRRIIKSLNFEICQSCDFNFSFLDSFLMENPMILSKFQNSNFLESIGKKFESNQCKKPNISIWELVCIWNFFFQLENIQPVRKMEHRVVKLKVFLVNKLLSSFFEFVEMLSNKVGCVFPMVVVSILSHAVFGRNDNWEDASHFRI